MPSTPYFAEIANPPFGCLLRIVFQGEDPVRVEQAAHTLAAGLAKDATIASGAASLLGPAPCPILKIRNLHRWHLIVKAREPETLAAVMAALPEAHDSGGVRMLVDRDPVALL